MVDPNDTNVKIASHLSDLEQIAQHDFPLVASIYDEAVAHCNSVHDDLAQIMERPDYFGGDTEGLVFKSYLDLHTVVVGFLNETAKNLNDTGIALDKAAKYFAGIDHISSDQFNNIAQYSPTPGYRLPGRRTNDNP